MSAGEMYGKLMSSRHADVELLTLLTDLKQSEVDALKAGVASGAEHHGGEEAAGADIVAASWRGAGAEGR